MFAVAAVTAKSAAAAPSAARAWFTGTQTISARADSCTASWPASSPASRSSCYETRLERDTESRYVVGIDIIVYT